MTLDEVKKLAAKGDLNACRTLEVYYVQNDEWLEALPYTEALAASGDETAYIRASTLYKMDGIASLNIAPSSEDAYQAFEKASAWAEKSGVEKEIVSSQQYLGESYYVYATAHKSEEFYVKSYNVLINTLGKFQSEISDLVWALCTKKLQAYGYDIPDIARRKKWNILLQSLDNRNELLKNKRGKDYLIGAALALGFELIEGNELTCDHTTAYRVFTVAHNELDFEMDDFLSKFMKNPDGSYTFVP